MSDPKMIGISRESGLEVTAGSCIVCFVFSRAGGGFVRVVLLSDVSLGMRRDRNQSAFASQGR
jgi:hypothetical protein